MDSAGAWLLSLLCLIDTGVSGDPSFCTFEVDGNEKYFTCQRNERCCKLGCCLSPSFQFYQLWLYWLMVIFMLVVCSGGQWWYKYWVGGSRDLVRRRGGGGYVVGQAPPASRPRLAPALHPPPPASSSSSSSAPPAPSSITLVHHMCKPHLCHARPEGKIPSPYEQIYGPPPSYESVVSSTGHSSTALPPSYTATDLTFHPNSSAPGTAESGLQRNGAGCERAVANCLSSERCEPSPTSTPQGYETSMSSSPLPTRDASSLPDATTPLSKTVEDRSDTLSHDLPSTSQSNIRSEGRFVTESAATPASIPDSVETVMEVRGVPARKSSA